MRPLEKIIFQYLDAKLHSQPEAISLAFIEHHDPYQSLTEALSWIRHHHETDNESMLFDIVKVICQIGYTLSLPISELQRCLDPFARRIESYSTSNQRVVHSKLIDVRDIINKEQMNPVNYGSRVEYPLGLLFVDGSGKVLSKAKVIAAG